MRQRWSALARTPSAHAAMNWIIECLNNGQCAAAVSVVAAAVAALGALAAAAVAAYQVRIARFALGAETVRDYDTRFNGDDFRKTRREAALSLRAARRAGTYTKDADDVLDLFETLGYLVRRKAIDKEFVWHTFFYWIHGYWRLSEPGITDRQKTDPAVYGDLRDLHRGLLGIEKRKTGLRDDEIEPKDLDEFLVEEAEEPDDPILSNTGR